MSVAEHCSCPIALLLLLEAFETTTLNAKTLVRLQVSEPSSCGPRAFAV